MSTILGLLLGRQSGQWGRPFSQVLTFLTCINQWIGGKIETGNHRNSPKYGC